MTTSNFFSNRPLPLVASGLALVAIGWLDLKIGGQIDLTILYLLPILWVTWTRHLGLAIVYAAIAMVEDHLSSVVETGVVQFNGVAFWNEITQLSVFIVLILSFWYLKKALDKEKRLSRTDPLTGLLNQRGLNIEAQKELERARRNNKPISAAFIDLDNFKTINDKWGHQVGDDLIKEIANILSKNLRPLDHIARIGGDEFFVLISETQGDTAKRVLKRMMKHIEQSLSPRFKSLGLSVGLATFPKPPASLQPLIQRSDDLMYEAKQKGKNQLNYLEVSGLTGAH